MNTQTFVFVSTDAKYVNLNLRQICVKCCKIRFECSTLSLVFNISRRGEALVMLWSSHSHTPIRLAQVSWQQHHLSGCKCVQLNGFLTGCSTLYYHHFGEDTLSISLSFVCRCNCWLSNLSDCSTSPVNTAEYEIEFEYDIGCLLSSLN